MWKKRKHLHQSSKDDDKESFFSVSIRSSFCRHEMAQIVLVFFPNLF